jgi:hypothetical protein
VPMYFFSLPGNARPNDDEAMGQCSVVRQHLYIHICHHHERRGREREERNKIHM